MMATRAPLAANLWRGARAFIAGTTLVAAMATAADDDGWFVVGGC